MGINNVHIKPTQQETDLTASKSVRRHASAPARMLEYNDKSSQGSDTLNLTGRSSQDIHRNDVGPKPPKQNRKVIVSPTSEDEVETFVPTSTNNEDPKNALGDHDKRAEDHRHMTSIFETKCPRSNYDARPTDSGFSGKNASKSIVAPNKAYEESQSGTDNRSNDDARPTDSGFSGKNASKSIVAPTKAWVESQSGTDNRQESTDQTKKKKKKKKKNQHREETRVTDTAEGYENREAVLSYDMNKLHEYERNVKRLEALVNQLREEKDGLLNRLSEIGAIKLTENNPNITDLCDANRPEKVVEQLSELYDNEWTDAYEYLTKTRGETTECSVNRLLKVLQEVCTICMSSTEKKAEALREAISNYVGLTKQDADELDLKDIEKRIREYRLRKLQNNFASTEEEVEDQLKIILTTEVFEGLSKYIGSCVIICWKICTKEPPMYLDFGDCKQTAESGEKKPVTMHFDKSKFVSYTKAGDYIEYVVWPAVYLFKGGQLMKKGVAQGTTDTLEDIEYEDESDKAK